MLINYHNLRDSAKGKARGKEMVGKLKMPPFRMN